MVMLLFAAIAQAQTKSVDVGRAVFTWEYAGQGQPTEFRIKCGTSSGNYTTTKVITDPAARSYLFRDLGLGSGVYYCAMTAVNKYGGETPATAEIFFDAGVGASTPTKFNLD